MLLQRNWKEIQSGSDKIRIMHFNVLADQLASAKEFIGTTEEHLDWNHRKLMLLQIIENISPDILSLVECDHYQDFWIPELQKFGLTQSAIVTKNNTEKTHGVALFIREERFRVLEFDKIDDIVAVNSLVLQDKLTEKMLVVASTHLKAKKKVEIRAEQLSKIKEKYISEDRPFILFGDLNTTLEEDAVKKIIQELELRPSNNLEWTTWKENYRKRFYF